MSKLVQLQPIGNNTQEQGMDLSTTTNTEARYDVSGYDLVTVQFLPGTGVTTGVVTLQRSLDGCKGVALESAQTLGPSATMSSAIDCSGFDFLHVAVTTADSGKYARLVVKARQLFRTSI